MLVVPALALLAACSPGTSASANGDAFSVLPVDEQPIDRPDSPVGDAADAPGSERSSVSESGEDCGNPQGATDWRTFVDDWNKRRLCSPPPMDQPGLIVCRAVLAATVLDPVILEADGIDVDVRRDAFVLLAEIIHDAVTVTADEGTSDRGASDPGTGDPGTTAQGPSDQVPGDQASSQENARLDELHGAMAALAEHHQRWGAATNDSERASVITERAADPRLAALATVTCPA